MSPAENPAPTPEGVFFTEEADRRMARFRYYAEFSLAELAEQWPGDSPAAGQMTERELQESGVLVLQAKLGEIVSRWRDWLAEHPSTLPVTPEELESGTFVRPDPVVIGEDAATGEPISAHAALTVRYASRERGDGLDGLAWSYVYHPFRAPADALHETTLSQRQLILRAEEAYGDARVLLQEAGRNRPVGADKQLKSVKPLIASDPERAVATIAEVADGLRMATTGSDRDRTSSPV